MRKQIIVVGLGQFGLGLVKALSQADAEIIAVDSDETRVELASSWVSKAMCFDATLEEPIAQLQPEIRDVCICATGDQSKEVSIICTALFNQLGAKRIIARANDDLHARILRLVGAHEVVNPEWDFGARFAPRVLSEHFLGEMLVDANLVISEIKAPEFVWGKTLSELDLRKKFGLTVIALKRHSQGLIKQAGPSDVIYEDDIIISASSQAAITSFIDEKTTS